MVYCDKEENYSVIVKNIYDQGVGKYVESYARYKRKVKPGVKQGRRPVDPVLRFWQRVEKTETCWLFQGTLNRGYPAFCCHDSSGAYRDVGAHVFSYMLHNNLPIPTRGRKKLDINICHKCDVRNCVNPDHLWIGTQKQNINDAQNKYRRPSVFHALVATE